MIDKQKQIEELEKDIAVRMAMAKGVAGSMNKGVEGWLGEYLIEKGWIQIPENAVVLTREEYEQIYGTVKAYGELLKDFQEAKSVFEKEMEEAQKEFVKQFEEYEQAVCKETAEKFAELADEKSEYFDMGNGYIYKAVHIEDVYGICKEITEGKQ